MARFIPDVASEDIMHDSERIVYEALRGLPADFAVLHSFPWLRPTRDLSGEPLREGEADFVILHPLSTAARSDRRGDGQSDPPIGPISATCDRVFGAASRGRPK